MEQLKFILIYFAEIVVKHFEASHNANVFEANYVSNLTYLVFFCILAFLTLIWFLFNFWFGNLTNICVSSNTGNLTGLGLFVGSILSLLFYQNLDVLKGIIVLTGVDSSDTNSGTVGTGTDTTGIKTTDVTSSKNPIEGAKADKNNSIELEVVDSKNQKLDLTKTTSSQGKEGDLESKVLLSKSSESTTDLQLEKKKEVLTRMTQLLDSIEDRKVQARLKESFLKLKGGALPNENEADVLSEKANSSPTKVLGEIPSAGKVSTNPVLELKQFGSVKCYTTGSLEDLEKIISDVNSDLKRTELNKTLNLIKLYIKEKDVLFYTAHYDGENKLDFIQYNIQNMFSKKLIVIRHYNFIDSTMTDLLSPLPDTEVVIDNRKLDFNLQEPKTLRDKIADPNVSDAEKIRVLSILGQYKSGEDIQSPQLRQQFIEAKNTLNLLKQKNELSNRVSSVPFEVQDSYYGNMSKLGLTQGRNEETSLDFAKKAKAKVLETPKK